MNETGNSTNICAETVPNPIAVLRAAGKLTLADEEHLVRLYHDTMKRGGEHLWKLMAPAAAEQVEHYERAKAGGHE